jgi:hypothetical protein
MPIPRFSPREKMKQENLPPMKGDTYNIYCCYAPRVARRAPQLSTPFFDPRNQRSESEKAWASKFCVGKELDRSN